MRRALLVLCMLLGPVGAAHAQLSIGIGLPGVNTGVNFPAYPEPVRVPDYPVYYAPQLNANFFFYDGMYWVYQSDNWYACSWYNGPCAKPTGIPVLRDLLPPALDTRVVNPLVSYAGSQERVLSGCALLQFTPVAINAIPCGASRGLHLMPCRVKL